MTDTNPVLDQLTAAAFLVLEASDYRAKGPCQLKVAKVTQGYPALTDSQVAVRVNVTINRAVFKRGMASLTVEIPDDLVIASVTLE